MNRKGLRNAEGGTRFSLSRLNVPPPRFSGLPHSFTANGGRVAAP